MARRARDVPRGVADILLHLRPVHQFQAHDPAPARHNHRVFPVHYVYEES